MLNRQRESYTFLLFIAPLRRRHLQSRTGNELDRIPPIDKDVVRLAVAEIVELGVRHSGSSDQNFSCRRANADSRLDRKQRHGLSRQKMVAIPFNESGHRDAMTHEFADLY